MTDLDEGERLHISAIDAAGAFADMCARFHEGNAYPTVAPLEFAINTLMTELWDRGFSQTEIRKAFEDAVADLPRYAAGEERNGRGVRSRGG